MTDIGKVGFSTDTGSLVQLQDELDRLKTKVDSLNSSLKNVDPSSGAAKAKLAELKVATNDYQTAMGNLVEKQIASGKVTQALDTIVKNTGASYQQAAQAVKEVIAAHAQADSAVGKTAAALGAAGQAAAASGAEASKSGGFFSSLAAMLGFSAGSTDKHTIATHALAAAHRSGSHDMTEYREIVHSIGPALEGLGVRLSSLTQLSYAARGGLSVLGASIIGGVAVAVAKASDEADLAKRRLEGLAGVKIGNELADGLKKVSTELGTSRTAAAPAFEALSKIVNLNTPPGGIRVMGADQPQLLDAAATSANNLAKSYEAIFMQLRLGGAETTAATAAANKFFEDLAKNGKVTSQMVDDLRKVAPAAATTLANAFSNGKLNVDQFVESLKNAPISLEKILEMLPRIRDGSQATFSSLQERPISVASAVDRLKESFETLFQTIDGGTKDRPGAIAQFIGQVAEDLESFNTAVVNAKAGTDDWNTNLGALFGTLKMIASPFRQMGTDIADFVKGITNSDKELGSSAGLFETLGHAVGVASSAIGSFVSIIGGGLGTGLAAIGNFVMNSIQRLTDWANQAIGLARSVGVAIAQAFTNQNSSAQIGNPMDNAGAGGSVAEQAQAQSGVDYAAAVGEGTYPAFATGGSFVVGGSGGTDSQLIQFMATPGEKVSIDTPDVGGAAKTIGSLIPSNDNGSAAQGDLISAHIAEDFRDQTAALSDKLGIVKDAIVAAIGTLSSAMKASTNQTVASAAVAAAGTSTASTSLGAIGGSTTAAASRTAATTGGANVTLRDEKTGSAREPQAPVEKAQPQPNNDAAEKAAYAAWQKLWQDFSAKEPGTGIGSDGTIHPPATGQLDEHGLSQKVPLPQARPTDAPKGDETVKSQTDTLKQAQTDSGKTVADAVNSQTSDVKTIGDKTNDSLGSVEKATQDSLTSLDAVNTATQAGTDATTSGFDQANQSLDGVKSASDLTTEGVGQTTDAVSSGSSNIVQSVGTAASEIAAAVAGAVSSAASSPSASSPSGFSGGSNFGFGGDSSMGGGSAVGGGPDQSFAAAMLGGASYASAVGAGTYPAMAIGGQFTVNGSGATDTEHVQFMASPGEVVTVTPPGGTAPGNPSMGGSSPSKSGLMAFATGGQFTLGDAMGGEPSMAGADIVSAHLAENTRDQTADLKEKLETVADKIIEAIKAGSNMIRNAVTAALAQMAADARASAQAAAAARSGGGVATVAGAATGAGGGLRSGAGYRGGTDNGSRGPLPQNFYDDPIRGPSPIIQYKGMLAGGGSFMNENGANPSYQGVSPFGGMSEGGAFVVPGGAGGSDSVSVAIKASPGEKIIVLPPQQAKALDDLKNTIRVSPEALSKFMPALQDNIPGGGNGAMSGSVIAGGAAAAIAGVPGKGEAKSVNIFVQKGLSADTFIQSRAQVERAMRR